MEAIIADEFWKCNCEFLRQYEKNLTIFRQSAQWIARKDRKSCKTGGQHSRKIWLSYLPAMPCPDRQECPAPKPGEDRLPCGGKRLVTERKPSPFQNAIGSKACNEREEKDTDFPETCKTTGNLCLICQAHNGMLEHSFAEKSEEKSKAAAGLAQRNGR